MVILLGTFATLARTFLVPSYRCYSKNTIVASSSMVSGGDKDDWFQKGLQFSCQMCGHCCSGSSGSVRFTEDEAMKMASHVKVSKEVFYKDFTRRRGSKKSKYYELKEQRTPDGDYDCIFLDRVTMPGKSICSLYDARPAQCRTWPFWEENLVTEKAWIAVSKGVEGCAGIGVGRLVPYEDIIKQRDETIALESEWNGTVP